ncbi:MAG: hypothetical protein WC604_03995 [Candidatus Gracilibacteria bacterium]
MARGSKERVSKCDKLDEELKRYRDSADNSVLLAVATAVTKGRVETAEEVLKEIGSLKENGVSPEKILREVERRLRAVLRDVI